MELINGIQIEVTEITIKKNNLLNRRDIFKFKRLLFIGDVLAVSEENYLVTSNYVNCSALFIENEGWIKVVEPFEDLKEIHSKWWYAKTSEVSDISPAS